MFFLSIKRSNGKKCPVYNLEFWKISFDKFLIIILMISFKKNEAHLLIRNIETVVFMKYIIVWRILVTSREWHKVYSNILNGVCGLCISEKLFLVYFCWIIHQKIRFLNHPFFVIWGKIKKNIAAEVISYKKVFKITFHPKILPIAEQ